MQLRLNYRFHQAIARIFLGSKDTNQGFVFPADIRDSEKLKKEIGQNDADLKLSRYLSYSLI